MKATYWSCHFLLFHILTFSIMILQNHNGVTAKLLKNIKYSLTSEGSFAIEGFGRRRRGTGGGLVEFIVGNKPGI